MKKIFTLFALLALVANMGWATDYCVAHNGKLNSNSWSASADKMSLLSGTVYTLKFTNVGTDEVEYKITEGSWTTSYNGIDASKSDVTLSNSSNITFTLSSASDVTICFDSSTKKSWVVLGDYDPDAIKGDLLAVLKGEKIMFYYGDLWGSGTKYLRTSNSTSDTYDSGSSSERSKVYYSGSSTIGSYHCRAVAINTSDAQKFYISNSSSWSGVQMSEKAVAGRAYILNNNSSVGGSSNNVKASPDRNGANFSQASYTITEGTAVSGISATAAETSSVVNQSITIKYYITTDNTTFSAFDVNDASALTVGSYTIVAVTYDGYIYVKAATATLTVQSASATAHNITYTTQATGWTYGTNPVSVEDGENLVFEVNPSAGYNVTVKNGDAMLSPAVDGKTYTVSNVTEDVTINVSATAQYFGITYPTTATNYTLSGHSETAATDEEVSFTVTPADGYKVTVTSEQAAISKNGNNYSFTMPASAVTVSIVATEIPMTTLYFWNKDSWGAVAAHMWDGSATSTTWPGKKLETAEYKSDNHSVYKVSFEEGAYGKIIFNNNGGGQQTDNLTVTSNNGKCYYGKEGGWNDLPEENWKVTISAENGSVESSKYVGATQKTVSATANAGYVFDKWEATGGVTIVDGSSATATVTATAEGTLKAIFKEDPNKFTVSFSSFGGIVTAAIGGTAISNGDKFTIGEPKDVVFNATATNSSDTFYGWYDAEYNKVSEENPYTATGVNANYVIKAVYAGKYYLKHPWNGGNDWAVKELTFNPATSLFYLYDYYGDAGFNYGNTESVSGWNGGASSNTLVGSPAQKDWCLITSPGNEQITVTKVTESHTMRIVGDNVTTSIKVNGADATSALHMQPATFTATAVDGYGFDGWFDNATFTGEALSADASYTVAVEDDITLYAKTKTETQYAITVANNVNSETTTLQVGATAKQVTAAEIAGYAFRNWTVTDNVTIIGEAAANPVTITATGTGTLTANYEAKDTIYFRNTLSWTGDIYAYVFKGNVWDDYVRHNKVVAAAGKMTNEGNGLFSYEYDGAEASEYIAFANKDMISWSDFYGGKAVYRGDYKTCRSVFVPDASQTAENKNSTEYYNSGYWTTNSTKMGVYFHYTGHWDDASEREFVRDNVTDSEGKMTIHLDAGTYEFKIHTCNGSYYSKNGTMVRSNHEDWTMSNDVESNCQITADVPGDYTFTFDISNKNLSVTYPSFSCTFTPASAYMKKDASQTIGIATTQTGLTITSLKVYASTDGSNWGDAIATLAADATGFTFTPAASGEYRFKIDAYNGDSYITSATSDADIVSVPAVSLTSATSYTRNVTYTLAAQTEYFSNESITYSYVVTDPNNQSVSLTNGNQFVPATVGSYSVAITASYNNEVIATGNATITVSDVTATITATGNPNIGQKLTLNWSSTGIDGTPSYTISVMEPGSQGYQTLLTNVTTKTTTYKLSSVGQYKFRVQVTTQGGTGDFLAEHVIDFTSYAVQYYIRYYFRDDDKDGNIQRTWNNVEMLYNEADGTYYYYRATAESTDSNTKYWPRSSYTDTCKKANIWKSGDAQGENAKAYTIYGYNTTWTAIEDGNVDVVFHYDVKTDSLYITEAEAALYRIKSVCGEKTYYSNAISGADSISFYAENGGTLSWQNFLLTDYSWHDIEGIVTATIPTNGVYCGLTNVKDSLPSELNVTKYTGKYYIYSALTEKTIEAQKATKKGEMTSFSKNADEAYSMYWVKWGKDNAAATVGNHINTNLANRLPDYDMPDSANIRYAFEPTANYFTRTFLAGSTDVKNQFVTVYGQNLYKNAETTITSPANGLKLTDGADWIYTADILAEPESWIKLAAQYNGFYTYLVSLDGIDKEVAKVEAIKETAQSGLSGKANMHIVYDYKTNRIVSGWYPKDQDINSTINVKNIIISRENDQESTQFALLSAGKIVVSEQMTTEFVISKDYWNSWTGNEDGGYKTLLYWITLPYDCPIWKIYGLGGGYSQTGTSFEIQAYRGDLRDKGTAGSTAWRRLNKYATMKANEGYALSVRLKASDFREISDKDGNKTSNVRLFFPSAGEVTLTPTVQSTLTDYITNAQAVQRDWHVMGVPVMKSGQKMVENGKETAPFDFAYRWTWANGGRLYEPIKIKEGDDYFKFLSGHAYMVQGHGNLKWTYEAAGTGNVLNAPRRVLARTNMDLRLELVRDEEVLDKAYVMYREDAIREYEIGRDLLKIENAGRSMIYAEYNDKLAAICLSDTDQMQIPLTVVADEAGDYTFRMSGATGEMVPMLVDMQEGTSTPLTEEYTLTLSAGTYQGRFFLNTTAQAPAVPTELENTESSRQSAAQKVLIDGKIYILKDNHIFSVSGARLK